MAAGPSQPKTLLPHLYVGMVTKCPLHRVIERLDKGNVCEELSTAVGTEPTSAVS